MVQTQARFTRRSVWPVMTRRKPKVGNKTRVLLRCSTVADAERDFALNVYAEEGDWDLVGNNAQESRQFCTEQPEENCNHDGRKR